jgi:hypothetical protein
MTKWTFYRVSFGISVRQYLTEYHALQFARALALSGIPFKYEEVQS